MDEGRRTVSEESVRDRLASLSRREIVGLVLIVVATLAGSFGKTAVNEKQAIGLA